MLTKYKISKEKQLKELNSRVPPILNVDIVILKDGKYLVGFMNPKRGKQQDGYPQYWLFPGGRVRFTETPEEAAHRILTKETPGISAQLKKLITVISDRGHDSRAYGVTIYYLFEYKSGKPRKNDQLIRFKWVNRKELLGLPRAYSLDQRIVNEIDVAIRTRNTSEDEILVEVNKQNKVIGIIPKRIAHSTNKRYHRAAHIIIFNSKGEVILQKRPITKAQMPGYWDIHGGHQADGQTIQQTAQAELSEELGITTNLQFKKVRLLKLQKQAEFAHVYYGIHDGPYGFDRNEVEKIQAFDPEKILKGKYKNYKFVDILVKPYLRDLKKVWEPLRRKHKK